ncbi:telomeric repeat-binding factor 1-like [Latimeria chalumnae]|uniref:telomeric repeat-binding factor 1-like n=1 Tax=Latimeria chalumnae TaxID=7897 RepID=UPI00313D7535
MEREAAGEISLTAAADQMEDEFSVLESLANKWIMEFLCYSQCHHFKRDELQRLKQKNCVMEDVRFEKDRSITPLESALLIWRLMEREGEIKQNQFFEELKLLLQVQSVAVCMEHGQYHIATEILERQFEEDEQRIVQLTFAGNEKELHLTTTMTNVVI